MNREIKRKLKRIGFVRSLLGLGVIVTLGFSIRQAQTVCTQQVTMHKEAQKQLRRREQEPLQELNQLWEQWLEQRQLLESLLWEEYKLFYKQEQEQRQLREQRRQGELEHLQELKQQLNQAWLLLGLFILSFMALLFLLLSHRQQVSLTGQFFLPEEYIAELEALHQRMKSQQKPLWFIQLRMLQEVVELLWAFYIHIRIENLWLPGINKKIDD